jgi:hypothetical protein
MTYEEFLLVPLEFVNDLGKILELKRKWELSFTDDEKMLRRYLLRMKLVEAARQSRTKFDRSLLSPTVNDCP